MSPKTSEPCIYSRIKADGIEVYDVFISMPYGRVCRRGHTWEDAKTIKAALLLEKARYKAGKVTGIDSGGTWGMTVEELAEEWLEHKEKHRAASTVTNYRSLYKYHIMETFRGRTIASVRPREIQRHIDSLAERPRTANSTLTVLKGMFRQAVLWDYLEFNPAAEIRRVPERFIERPFLTTQEAADLLSVLEGRDRLLIFTALVTGMREGELAALKWENVQGDKIFVRQSYRKGVFSDPKSYYGRRTIHIPEELREELESVRGNPHYLVFPDEPYAPLPDWKMTKRILYPALKRAGIEKKITFHDLRHTTAAWLTMQGASPLVLQKVLGHHSPAFSMSRYGHLAPETQEAAAVRFAEETVSKLHQKGSKQKGTLIAFPQRDGDMRP